MNVENHSTPATWLNDAKTWSMYAELANITSISVLAKDMYSVSRSKDEENITTLGLFAKAQRQVGDDKGAIKSIGKAITLLQLEFRAGTEDFESKEKQLKAFGKWKDLWSEEIVNDDEEGSVNSNAVLKENANLLKARIKMNIKPLIKTQVEISKGKTLINDTTDYGGDIDYDDLSLEDFSIASDFSKTMLVAPNGQLVPQKKPKLQPWQVLKRDKFRQFIFETTAAGLKRFALFEFIRRTDIEGKNILDEMIPKDPRLNTEVFENGLSCAVFGLHCLKIPRSNINRLGMLLLERAKVRFKFEGVEDYIAKFEVECLEEGKDKRTLNKIEKLQRYVGERRRI